LDQKGNYKNRNKDGSLKERKKKDESDSEDGSSSEGTELTDQSAANSDDDSINSAEELIHNYNMYMPPSYTASFFHLFFKIMAVFW
jgi:hypothetical protein